MSAESPDKSGDRSLPGNGTGHASGLSQTWTQGPCDGHSQKTLKGEQDFLFLKRELSGGFLEAELAEGKRLPYSAFIETCTIPSYALCCRIDGDLDEVRRDQRNGLYPRNWSDVYHGTEYAVGLVGHKDGD